MGRLANKPRPERRSEATCQETVYTRSASTPGFREHGPRGAGLRPRQDFRTCAFNRIDIAQKSCPLPFTGDDVRPMLPSTSVVLGLVEEVRAFSGYRIEVDIPVNNWPADQGDNYAAILGFFCDRVPENVILFVGRDKPLHYPAIRVEPVEDNSRCVYVLIDTIGVHTGKLRYDFVMFMDKDLRVYSPSVSPGCL
jgi:hypothetical protein